jgi:uncharacterized membrane protein YraQ (UPF0718 family)
MITGERIIGMANGTLFRDISPSTANSTMSVSLIQDLRFFASVTLAIFLEAAPFLLLGSLVSSFFEIYVPSDFITRLMPKRVSTGIGVGLLGGMIMPTCECGVAPIALRLIRKGVPSHTAMAFMLASPVVNPIVLISTYMAFRGDWTLVGGRILLTIIPAACVAWSLSGIPPEALLRNRGGNKTSEAPTDFPMAAEHAHGLCCDHAHDDEGDTSSRPIRLLRHTGSEFLDMGRYLLFGSFAAGLFKTFVPLDLVFYIQEKPFLAVGGMMLLAVLLSVCSEADAFVAASFTAFPKAAQLSFTAIGPMVDLKLAAIFFSVFHKRVVAVLLITPSIIIYILSLVLMRYLG